MARYRPAVKIVLTILECIAKGQAKGRALKTHIIQCSNLKTTTSDRYFEMLKDAGYIIEKKESWGARTVLVYELTPLGRERYHWFKKINGEIFDHVERLDG